MTFILIVVLCLLFVLFIYWKLVRSGKRVYDALRNQGIPGEPFKPLIGQIFDVGRAVKDDNDIAFWTNLTGKHGYLSLFSLGPMTLFFVCEPDIISGVLGRSYAQNYIKPTFLSAAATALIGSQNILMSEGLQHDRARKMLNPAFHFDNLRSIVSIMVDQTTKAIDELLLLSSQHESIDLQTEFSSLTLSIIASSAFGRNINTMKNAKEIVHQGFTTVLEAMQYRTLMMIDKIPLLAKLPFWKKDIVDKGCQQISDFVDEIINDRRCGRSTSLSTKDDLLDVLLSAIDNDGKSFTDREIKDEALSFVFAGHETTSTLMTWVMYILMTNEELLQVCQDEIDRVLPNKMQLSYEQLGQLQICEAVLQETLRLYPPVPFLARRCIREHAIDTESLGQITVPIDTNLFFNIYELHRRNDLWSRPLEFDYTRWMRDPVTGLKPKLPHPYSYLPFGTGSRNCIGQNFAMLEGKVILAMILQRCRFELEPGQKFTSEIRVTMRLKYGLKAKITRRSS